jgi:hypothetical protein
VELHPDTVGDGLLLSLALQRDDLVCEVATLPWLVDTGRLLARDHISRRFLNDGPAPLRQAAQDRGLPSSGRTGQDIALHQQRMLLGTRPASVTDADGLG